VLVLTADIVLTDQQSAALDAASAMPAAAG